MCARAGAAAGAAQGIQLPMAAHPWPQLCRLHQGPAGSSAANVRLLTVVVAAAVCAAAHGHHPARLGHLVVHLAQRGRLSSQSGKRAAGVSVRSACKRPQTSKKQKHAPSSVRWAQRHKHSSRQRTILLVRVPATIMQSDWRGEGRKMMPKRSKS